MNRLLLGMALGVTTLTLAACQEKGSAPVPLTAEAIAKDWAMTGFNGGPALPRTTLDLTEAGRAAGQAPCNRWFASVEGTLPELRFGGAGATRMACPDLEAESKFFEALGKITTASLEGETLILSGSDGVRLEFLPVTR